MRLASMDDVPSLLRLIDASVRGLSTGYYSEVQIEQALHLVFGPDTQLIADGTYFVIDGEDGQLVASGGWSKRRTLFGGDQHKDARPDPLLDPVTEAARLRAMFVHPDAARRGLGRRVFDACRLAAEAAGFRSMELAATLPGVALYEALGFVQVESFATPLRDGLELPLVRMRRALEAVPDSPGVER
ncbi:MAG: GNAT family N-acetyltransferase [bacterium]